ncbi:MAG TPA: protein-L-isoaspartate(D-aspartate) O-methyltransferase [Tenuifilaceae bacterium]|nr:protein-L-isoaspartate(D-aspartate) O-methyltransferase [Tenuifilaceae bacterium]HPI44767.1 protein-L-isoaspartate(D-aspartate) O-methyltransferase [Tenuifilaceae bacterium]HPN22827.1 protein-L-isoaspartate(D-aspartate) O-methyltransferase [Tenuifilaceae bacterium]HPV56394.1 protein-L-isoaspartate(D-aspartate) O-methyltransferase [Tenuifilaceae bacterium]
MLQQDTFQHKGLRKKLVEEVEAKGITDKRVLEALLKVPRHFFMESGFLNFAYRDQAFPIGAGQTISQPYTVAFQTELLQINHMDKVLEVGTGSGYQTAILMEMKARVYTIERQRELYLNAKALLEEMGYHPHFFYGDGYKGVPSYGPYNKILVTAGASEIPETLVEQLAVGGRMVIPVGDDRSQVMTLIEKISATEIKTTTHGNFIFVPLLKGTNK